MSVTYTWDLLPPSGTLTPLPDVGTYVEQTPTGTDPRKFQLVRGIKFANAPGGRSELASTAPAGQSHVSSGEGQHQPDEINANGRYSGAIKFKHRDYRKFPVPRSVSNSATNQGRDEFGNPVFSFTGKRSS